MKGVNYYIMNNLICPFCLQDISNGNHAWNCEMNPINMNNGEFQTYIPYINNLSNNPINNEIPHYYHLSWLEIAVTRFKKQNKKVHAINGNMTINEFIKEWMKNELCENVELD